MAGKFACPLCNSPLSETRYYEIVGVWEEKKKIEAEFKKKLVEADKLKEKLLKDTEEIKKREELLKKKYEEEKKLIIAKAQKEAEQAQKQVFQKELDKKDKALKEILQKQKQEIEQAKKAALIEGKEKMMKQQEMMNKRLEGKFKELEAANNTIKELKEQIKKGTTPQIEGLNFEEELVKELRHKFPSDNIEHHGKGGDILHYIIHENKQIGLIVYECKKTKTFSKDYVRQIKKDVVSREASYGVLVTFASEKDKSGFWTDEDILIVHPYGAIHLAKILRKSLVDLYSSRLGKKELEEMARNIFDYIKSNKFKNAIRDIIFRARELNELLTKEMAIHERLWEQRGKHYKQITEDSESINKDSSSILKEREEGTIEGTDSLPLVVAEKRKK